MEFFSNAEVVTTKWLKRRREAVEAAHSLVTRLRDARDVTEVFTAQQEWMTAAARRTFEDADSFGRAASMLASRATNMAQGVAPTGVLPAVEAAATANEKAVKAPTVK